MRFNTRYEKIRVNGRERETEVGKGQLRNNDQQEKGKLLKIQCVPLKTTPCFTCALWGRYGCQSHDSLAPNAYELETSAAHLIFV